MMAKSVAELKATMEARLKSAAVVRSRNKKHAENIISELRADYQADHGKMTILLGRHLGMLCQMQAPQQQHVPQQQAPQQQQSPQHNTNNGFGFLHLNNSDRSQSPLLELPRSLSPSVQHQHVQQPPYSPHSHFQPSSDASPYFKAIPELSVESRARMRATAAAEVAAQETCCGPSCCKPTSEGSLQYFCPRCLKVQYCSFKCLTHDTAIHSSVCSQHHFWTTSKVVITKVDGIKAKL